MLLLLFAISVISTKLDAPWGEKSYQWVPDKYIFLFIDSMSYMFWNKESCYVSNANFQNISRLYLRIKQHSWLAVLCLQLHHCFIIA